MNTIDRRALTRKILFGAAIAGLGLSAGPATVSAMPLDDRLPDALEGSIDKAQVVVTRPPPRRPPPRHRPRRRVWRCWLQRGRRVCGWRWV